MRRQAGERQRAEAREPARVAELRRGIALLEERLHAASRSPSHPPHRVSRSGTTRGAPGVGFRGNHLGSAAPALARRSQKRRGGGRRARARCRRLGPARPAERGSYRGRIRSGRAWRPVRQLGLANTLMGRAPMVAVSGRGDAFVAWVGRDDNALHVAMHAPARPWTSSILGDAANHPVVAANAAGDAAAAWIRLGEVRLPSARATGTGAPQLLSRPPRSPPITRASR